MIYLTIRHHFIIQSFLLIIIYLILRSLYSRDWKTLNILKDEMCCWYRYASQQHIFIDMHTHAHSLQSARMCMAECLFKRAAGMQHNTFFCMSYFITLNISYRSLRSSTDIPWKWFQALYVSVFLHASIMYLLSKIM